MINITSFNFKIDKDEEINILIDDAKKLYDDLTKYHIFGVKTDFIKENIVISDIFCDVKLNSGQQFDIHILKLKELYYVLDSIFPKTINVR